MEYWIIRWAFFSTCYLGYSLPHWLIMEGEGHHGIVGQSGTSCCYDVTVGDVLLFHWYKGIACVYITVTNTWHYLRFLFTKVMKSCVFIYCIFIYCDFFGTLHKKLKIFMMDGCNVPYSGVLIQGLLIKQEILLSYMNIFYCGSHTLFECSYLK